jgi:hypothetical protein
VAEKSEIFVLPKDERKRWREGVKALDEKWAAAVEAKGLPGRAILKDARELSAKYGEID